MRPCVTFHEVPTRIAEVAAHDHEISLRPLQCDVVSFRRSAYLADRMTTSLHTHDHAPFATRWIGGLDRYAIGLSGLCMVHCLATSVLVALMSTAGGWLLDPIVHEIGLTIAILLGALALGRGILHHGYVMPASMGAFGLGIMAGAMTLPHDGGGGETLWTIIGVGLLAFGHDLNRRAES